MPWQRPYCSHPLPPLQEAQGVREPQPLGKLAAPVRLEADGETIDNKDEISYAGPWIHDVDGDDKADLVVTGISGHMRWFKNVSEDRVPVYEDQGRIKARGEDVAFWNW